MIDTRLASSRAGATRRSLAIITLSALSLLMAAPLHAAPSADPASQPTRPAILTTWQTPEVAGGAVAPTIVLRLLVGTDGSVKRADVKQKRQGLAAAEKQAEASADQDGGYVDEGSGHIDLCFRGELILAVARFVLCEGGGFTGLPVFEQFQGEA